MDKYLSTDAQLERLKNEYIEHGRLIVAFDFDDTVCTYNKANPEPTAERPENEKLCTLLRKLYSKCYLILWTCRSDDRLKEAIHWLHNHNVKYDSVNINPFVDFGGPKLYANILLDDRAGLTAAYEVMIRFLEWMEERNV